MRVAIDTCALLDLLAGDLRARAAARDALLGASARGALVISSVVLAELMAAFESREELMAFVDSLELEVEEPAEEALWLASRAWRAYLADRGQKIQCSCGHRFEVTCPGCGHMMSLRGHILTDFLVRAHAKAQADMLLTRDKRLWSYFPDLQVWDYTSGRTSP